jgi:hypothetical protein
MKTQRAIQALLRRLATLKRRQDEDRRYEVYNSIEAREADAIGHAIAALQELRAYQKAEHRYRSAYKQKGADGERTRRRWDSDKRIRHYQGGRSK